MDYSGSLDRSDWALTEGAPIYRIWTSGISLSKPSGVICIKLKSRADSITK